jgi:hypothetical protein
VPESSKPEMMISIMYYDAELSLAQLSARLSS